MSDRPIKSAERTLRLFELFSNRQRRLTVSDVSRGVGIPQSSASVLLANLATMGYLEYEGLTRSYAPTVRISLIGSWLGPLLAGPRSLAAWLDELHRQVDEDLYVSIQNGSCAQIVMTRRAEDDLNIDSGQRHSLTKSAIGQAILASHRNREVIRLVRRCNAEAEERLRVNEIAFLAVVDDVRRKGYAVSTGDFEPGRMGIAVHFPSPKGGLAFGVSFRGPIDRVSAKRDMIVRRLREFRSSLGSEPLEGLVAQRQASRTGGRHDHTASIRRVAAR